MALSVCPAAVVAAPAETVWRLLADPRRYGWMAGRVVRVVPEGPASPGQTVFLRAGALTVTLTVLEVDEPGKRIALRLNLPLGMAVEPHISCAPLDRRTSRVQYG